MNVVVKQVSILVFYGLYNQNLMLTKSWQVSTFVQKYSVSVSQTVSYNRQFSQYHLLTNFTKVVFAMIIKGAFV